MSIILDARTVNKTPPRVSVPRTSGTRCLDRGGRYGLCSRAAGHTGRHHFAWVHLGGIVRDVWGDR